MTILKRSFIDVKRLATIGINTFCREPWLLDYVKSIAKPLEYTTSETVTFNKTMSEYVLYNGQKLTLKTYVDDYYDIEDRRTIIDENREEGYSFYGYFDNDTKTFKNEIDPNPTSLNGYGTYTLNNVTYTLESDLGNPLMYGYVMWMSLDALQDVDLEFITDNYDEYIYTSENATSENSYMYFLETQSEEGLIIYLHNDVYTSMTQQDLDKLFGLLSKYIIAPTRYKIEGYN